MDRTSFGASSITFFYFFFPSSEKQNYLINFSEQKLNKTKMKLPQNFIVPSSSSSFQGVRQEYSSTQFILLPFLHRLLLTGNGFSAVGKIVVWYRFYLFYGKIALSTHVFIFILCRHNQQHNTDYVAVSSLFSLCPLGEIGTPQILQR